ncbi:hypothetical protein [Acanthopleuribacter pedis]|uniref:Uncharacterized protein n=1 Tax=Acanthopleuribacter pedis TaxID=442870 RepID=A0A8J7QE11_9BACT|nr:hypothetical protein [Acanthopleuribacter pedis]MBO1317378.1 hypothetical protein [Acanthopleuribacter pedis]
MFAFFIVNESWLEMPLELSNIIKDGKSIYFIRQRSGGPFIHLYAPLEFQEKNCNYLPSGFPGLHGNYWDYERETHVKTSSQIKKVYKEAIRFAKKGSQKVTTNQRTYYICQNTIHRLGSTLLLGSPF